MVFKYFTVEIWHAYIGIYDANNCINFPYSYFLYGLNLKSIATSLYVSKETSSRLYF